MNYLKHPELIDQIAAAYVLGSLTTLTKKRFERLMMQSQSTREAVWYWESQLHTLNAFIAEEEKPSDQIWTAILKQIKPAIELQKSKEPQKTSKQQPSTFLFWENFAFLRGWGVFATACSVVFAFLFFSVDSSVSPIHSPFNQIAVIESEKNQPLWVASVDIQKGLIFIKAMNETAEQLEKSFELWVLPKDGLPPKSLGLLPYGGQRFEHVLSIDALKGLNGAQTLAVSLEPKGGSTTGLPTGPVVYTAPVIEL
jgi:anti-sigma-K factor RskA